MSDQALIPSQSRQQLAAQGRTQPGKVTGKLRIAIEAMVWQGCKRPEAAAAAGLTDHGLRTALHRPHVRQAYLAECEVLRTSGRARRIHRLTEISEQDENRQAAVNAIAALNNEETQALSAGRTVASPGLTIIVQGNATLPTNVDTPAKPLINNDRDMTIDHDPPPDPALPQRTRGGTGG